MFLMNTNKLKCLSKTNKRMKKLEREKEIHIVQSQTEKSVEKCTTNKKKQKK